MTIGEQPQGRTNLVTPRGFVIHILLMMVTDDTIQMDIISCNNYLLFVVKRNSHLSFM